MAEERLQKLLSRAGISSRRAAEALIVAGRVSVDGKIVRELGVRADARRQRIEVDGRRIVAEPFVYLILNKPRGVMCTLNDPEGRQTIKDLLKDVGTRVIPVGRLDYHTSGALLLTNDGEFAMKLAHPSGKVPKEYVAKVRGVLNEATLARFAESIEIDGRRTQPADLAILRVEGTKTWITITLREGRNRQVRRLGDEAGFPVLRLSRLSHAGITTEGLRPGQWRALTRDELIELKQTYGVPRRPRSAELPENRHPPRPLARPRPVEKRPGAPNRAAAGGTTRAGAPTRAAAPTRAGAGGAPRRNPRGVSRADGARAPSGRRGTSR